MCSYDVSSLCSNVSDFLVRRPVYNVSLPSHRQDLNVDFQSRCFEESSHQRADSKTVPRHFQWTIDLEHLNDLEEFGLPYAADVRRCTSTPLFKPETSASAGGTNTGHHSNLQVPYKFDIINDYHSSSSNTGAVSTRLEDNIWKTDVYRDIIDDLENVYDYSPSSTGSDLGPTMRLPHCSFSVYNSIPPSTHNSYSNCQHEDGFQAFQLSQQHASSVLFDNEDEAVTSFQTLRSRDFSEDINWPLHATSTWSQNHSCVTKNASEQTYVSMPEQFTSLATIGKVQTSSNDRQADVTRPRLSQTSCIDNEGRVTTTPCGSSCRVDFSKDIIPTSSLLKTTNAPSQQHSVVTPDLSTATQISAGQEHSASLTISTPYRALCSEEVAKAQTTCRRRLFLDTACCEKDNDCEMCKKSQQEQDGFRDNPQQTYAFAALDNEDDANKPFPAFSELGFSEDLSAQVSRIKWSSCRERCVTARESGDRQKCLSVANSGSRPDFSPCRREVGKTQTSRHRWLLDDTCNCYEADEDYTVCEKWQQHARLETNRKMSTCQPQTPCAVIQKEDDAATLFRPLSRFDFSDCGLVFSSGEIAEFQISCRRADNGYRVSQKSAANMCHVTRRRQRDDVRGRRSTTPRQHACSICHRRFTQPSNLAAHRRTHTGL